MAAAGITIVNVGVVVNDYTGGSAEIPIGSKVSSIYLFVQVQCDTVNNVVDFYVIKNPAGVVQPVPGATGGQTARKYVLHEEKGIPGDFTTGSPPLTFRGVIKIPRGRQRMAEGDVISVLIRGAAIYSACIKCIYKFYQ